MKLTNRTCVVTGAGGGLGKAIALAMAREGARVSICDINARALAAAASELSATGADVLAEQVDLTSSAAVAGFFAKTAAKFESVDILVNNAAIVPGRPQDEERRLKQYVYASTPGPGKSLGFTSAMSDEEWLRYWDVNVHGVFYCTREALKQMEPRGYGRIINIASLSGQAGISAHAPHYSATKGAVIAFTRAVASEVAGGGIFVNAISPGGVATPAFAALLDKMGDEKKERFFRDTPARRFGSLDEYASLAVYLAGEHYLVGQIISPNGGKL